MTTWRSVLAAQFFAPEFWSRRERRSGLCGAICRSPTKWRASGAHDPEKWRPVFGPRSCATKKGKRSAERRIVQPCPHRQTSLRNSSVRGCALQPAARRLSALTLAALATGYYPDGSAPEPGFPRRRLTGVLPASPNNTAVKHAPCGPVFVPVDRGPEAARERE